jgi:hypothetical protein
MLTGAGQRMHAPVSVFRRAGQRITACRSAYARAGQRITAILKANRRSLSMIFFLQPAQLRRLRQESASAFVKLGRHAIFPATRAVFRCIRPQDLPHDYAWDFVPFRFIVSFGRRVVALQRMGRKRDSGEVRQPPILPTVTISPHALQSPGVVK